jgi:hypothetical protein
MKEQVRLFWVVDSPDDNPEIFTTETDAEAYAKKYGDKAPYTIGIAEVRHFYQEPSGEWNYDDLVDTFRRIITLTMQNDTRGGK